LPSETPHTTTPTLSPGALAARAPAHVCALSELEQEGTGDTAHTVTSATELPPLVTPATHSPAPSRFSCATGALATALVPLTGPVAVQRKLCALRHAASRQIRAWVTGHTAPLIAGDAAACSRIRAWRHFPLVQRACDPLRLRLQPRVRLPGPGSPGASHVSARASAHRIDSFGSRSVLTPTASGLTPTRSCQRNEASRQAQYGIHSRRRHAPKRPWVQHDVNEAGCACAYASGLGNITARAAACAAWVAGRAAIIVPQRTPKGAQHLGRPVTDSKRVLYMSPVALVRTKATPF
jgi:hypothetical protein